MIRNFSKTAVHFHEDAHAAHGVKQRHTVNGKHKRIVAGNHTVVVGIVAVEECALECEVVALYYGAARSHRYVQHLFLGKDVFKYDSSGFGRYHAASGNAGSGAAVDI